MIKATGAAPGTTGTRKLVELAVVGLHVNGAVKTCWPLEFGVEGFRTSKLSETVPTSTEQLIDVNVNLFFGCQ